MLLLLFPYAILVAQTNVSKATSFEEPHAPDLLNIHIDTGKKFLYRAGSTKADLDSAQYYFDKALTLNHNLNSPSITYSIYVLLAELAFERKAFDEGTAYFQKATDYYHKQQQFQKEAQTWETFALRVFYDTPDLQRSIELYQKALALYKTLDDKQKQADILKGIADVNLNLGRLDLANQQLLEALDLYTSVDYQNLHYTYHLLSEVNKIDGNLEKSLLYALESINSMKKSGDSTSAHFFYKIVADNFHEIGNHRESAAYYKKAMHAALDGQNTHYYYTHADNYIKQLTLCNETEKALEALTVLENEHPTNTIYCNAMLNRSKGQYYRAVNKTVLALEHYKTSFKLFKKIEGSIFPQLMGDLNFELAQTFLENGSYDSAKYYLNEYLKIPKGINKLSRDKDCQLLLFKADSALGNYPEAIKYYQTYKRLNDSIFNEKKSKQIEELQILYETQKKEDNIASLQEITHSQENKLEKLNTTKNLTLGIVILLTLIIALLIQSYLSKQKSNRLLVSQKGEINQKNISLQHLLVEKEWLLKEIHHRVKNNLQILMSLLNTQSNYIENEEALEIIENSKHKLHAIALIHQKLYGAEDISVIRMDAYVKDLINYFRDSFNVDHITFNIDIDDIILDGNKSVPISLILSEALTNAIKYAYPNEINGQIDIIMKNIDNLDVNLKIVDQGIGLPKGFDPDQTVSLGMNLIRGLTKQLNGIFNISSNHGVLIEIVFPNNPDSKTHYQ